MLPIQPLKSLEHLERLWSRILRARGLDKNTKKTLILLVTIAFLFQGVIITQTLLILLMLYGFR